MKRLFHRFIYIRGNPGEIALGFSLGLFVGMSPFMFCHTVTAVFLASLLKWNKISAAVGVMITNPLTAPFFYTLTYFVGTFFVPSETQTVFPDHLNTDAVIALLKDSPRILWILTVGGVVSGIPISIAGYYLSYWCISKIGKNEKC